MRLFLFLLLIILINPTDAKSQTGLNYTYYEGNWFSLPDFNSLTPVKQGVTNNVDLSIRNRDLLYGVVWKGYINVPATGNYTFETNSDDGSKLYIGDYNFNATALVNNDYLHENRLSSGTMYLNAGSYPITITYFNNQGYMTLEVYWSSSSGIARQRIPDNAFTTNPVEEPPVNGNSGGLTGINNYYFSSSTGDDSRSSTQAQDPATPWRTLNKLNSFLPNLNAGDAVLFKRGEVFDGSITIPKSGTSGQPLIFSAYGNGNKPVINGLFTLSTWVSLGNGVWEASCPSSTNVNMVAINGVITAMGRFPNITAPNKGYLSYESHSGSSQITDNQLASSPNWTGAELVIRKQNWVLDRGKITQHSGNSITYVSPSTLPIADGHGYFIQDDIRTLDQTGEWYFDAAQKKIKIYFGSNNPNSYDVRVSVTDNLVFLDNKSNITFDNLSLQGADVEAYKIQNSQNIRIQNIDISLSGTQAIDGTNINNLVIENSSITNTNNDAIQCYNCSYTTIKNTQIKNTGLIPGMGLSNNQQYEAIFIQGSNNLIESNQVINTGNTAITFHGDLTTVKNNFIDHFTMTVEDGGGIYMWGDFDKFGRKITGNIIINGVGSTEGTNSLVSAGSSGIMLDDLTGNVEISDNTIANCVRAGIFIHNSHEITMSGNTVFNNRIQLSMTHDNLGINHPIRNMNVRDNIFFSKIPDQFVSENGSNADDIGSFGSYDNNYYARPMDENGIIYASYSDQSGSFQYAFYDLDGWKTRYGHDLHSQKSPVKIPSFTVNRLVGGNRYSNGSFNSNVNGVFCLASPGQCTATWNSGGKLDGGALQISFDPAGGQIKDIGTYIGIGSVEAGKNYVIKFSLLGSKVDKTIKAFLMQNGGAYSRLSATRYFDVTTSRTENEFLFSSATTESDVLIAFEINGNDSPLWMDNLQVYEAEITQTNPDDYIRFEYNSGATTKTVPLNGDYIDVKNNRYSGSVNLNPYTSVILMKQSLSAQSLSVPSAATRITEVDLQANTSGAISVRINPNPVNDKLQIFVSAPPNSKKGSLSIHDASGLIIKRIPLNFFNRVMPVDVSSLSSGVYILNFVSDGVVINKKFIKL